MIGTVVPPGRALADWWNQLAPHQPRRLWFADWLIHRLDALVAVRLSSPLEPLLQLLLDAIALSAPVTTARLALRLGLEDAILARLLVDLVRDGLIADPTGWHLTEAGQQARREGRFDRQTLTRRPFHLSHDPRTFLALTGHGSTFGSAEPLAAALEDLRDWTRRPATWKRATGFPEDMVAVADAASAVPTWQRIAIDRPERWILALIQGNGGDVAGFSVRRDGWVLSTDPVLSRDATAVEDLHLPDPDGATWRAAWREWLASVPGCPPEAADAPLERIDDRLVVTLPIPLVHEWETTRPELTRGEGWLLAGTASTRAAVRIHVRG